MVTMKILGTMPLSRFFKHPPGLLWLLVLILATGYAALFAALTLSSRITSDMPPLTKPASVTPSPVASSIAAASKQGNTVLEVVQPKPVDITLLHQVLHERTRITQSILAMQKKERYLGEVGKLLKLSGDVYYANQQTQLKKEISQQRKQLATSVSDYTDKLAPLCQLSEKNQQATVWAVANTYVQGNETQKALIQDLRQDLLDCGTPASERQQQLESYYQQLATQSSTKESL